MHPKKSLVLPLSSLRFSGAAQRAKPYLALGAGILALSFSGLFVRWAGAPGAVMGFYRIGLATLLLSPAFLRRRAGGTGRRNLLEPRVLLLPVLGGLFTALDHALWNTATNITTVSNATTLNNTAPLWVSLAAWLFFHERLQGRFWLGLALVMTGAAAVLGHDFIRRPALGWGDLLALASGLFYAGYFLVTQRGRSSLDTLSYIWIVGLTSSLALLAMSLIFRQPLSGYSNQTYLAFVGAAVISHLGGYLSVGYALGHLPASVVSPTMIGQPVITTLLAIPLIGETPHPAQLLGGLAVLVGIYQVHRSRTAQR